MIEGCDWEEDFKPSETPSTPKQNAIAACVAAVLAFTYLVAIPLWVVYG